MRRNRPDHIPGQAWDRMCDGVEFDERRGPSYTSRGGGNEINLNNDKRLDSYLPAKEIVSRKHTQLAQVREETAIGYLRELDRKYSPDQTIKDTPRNRDQLPGEVGRNIRGAPVLEIPPQHTPVPSAVLEEADRLGITIRDSDGKVYELP
jgi:hypothetical protein